MSGSPIEDFADLCFVYANERLAALKNSDARLAHYTSAENGLRILAGRSIWLRNALVMNDFSEIAHGQTCLDFAFNDQTLTQRFIDAVDVVHKGLVREVVELWQEYRALAFQYTYLAAFSQLEGHDTLGKLSMWRAYGGPAGGVALVFSNNVLDIEGNPLGAYHSPVLYADGTRFLAEFERVVDGLERNTEVVARVSREEAKQVLYNALLYSVLSTKHMGFEEEQEWRLIYSLSQGESSWIVHSPESINGIPQVVCKIPLANKAGLNMPELSLDNLIERVLIGPCAYPLQVADAYRKVLIESGVQSPRIDLSTIPLRQRG